MVAPASKGLIPQPVLMSAFRDGADGRFRQGKNSTTPKGNAAVLGCEMHQKPRMMKESSNRLLTDRFGLDTLCSSSTGSRPVLQRSIIAETLAVAGLAATRFGMIIGTGTTTMPSRAGRV